MKTSNCLLLACGLFGALTANARGNDTIASQPTQQPTFFQRLSVGGYGEAVMTRNFYSDKYLRYISPENYKNESHGRFDLPHVVIFLGYDFGHGWSMSSEIEFEHGGVETATEIEQEEAGEYENEIERGGEVALEQFWIQKSFMPQLNVRVGHMVVPVGYTNTHHLPTEFFGNYRPAGENTIMPCTWHETGISVWGQAGKWRYEAMFMPGLDSERFGNSGWIHDGSASPYEFKIANTYAGAVRVDNYSVRGLRIGVSGYIGNSFRNTLYPQDNKNNDGIHGTVTIGAVDFTYNDHNIVARGNFDYGHLSDSKHISNFNRKMSQNSPSKRQEIASDAMAAGVEVGYNFFGLSRSLTARNQKFYLFGRYDYHNSMYKMEDGQKPLKWTERNRMTVGINYFPMRDIVVKADYAVDFLQSPYNNEPAISIGIAYAGWFK